MKLNKGDYITLKSLKDVMKLYDDCEFIMFGCGKSLIAGNTYFSPEMVDAFGTSEVYKVEQVDGDDFVFYNVIPITVERKESDYVWLYSLIFVLILCCGVFIFFVCKKKRSAINERTSSFIDETTNSISSQMEIQNDEDSNDSSEKQKGFIQSDESSK